MHVVTSLIAIIALIIRGEWKYWKTYHSTVLYVALGNLLYNFLTANYFLWRLDADFISNHTLTELLYTFIVFPATVLMFLHDYPEGLYKQIIRILKWIFIYGVWEYVFSVTGRIEYQYGWSFWWSIAFLFVMFPLIRLHHTHPLLTYLLTVIVASAVIWWFEVPVHIPVEMRHLHSN
ncbi:CBO0543 family protein [Evansella halocellulosilytica]|uniref:CBO0543 family protein n=1 Tax=Evansella halocellulosilytica TaxID=2011013 RepID=UPI000BB6A478|nr:CBO0543 family protein [Evansella halocellulosilytica]